MKTKSSLILLIAVILQAIVFNQMGNFIPYLPYFGLIPVLLFPFKNNKTYYLIYAFINGLLIDLITGTGGVFAATAITIAYTRDLIIRFFKDDWIERHAEVCNLSFILLLLYLLTGSFLITLLVYIFDSGSFVIPFRDSKHLVVHAMVNAFFYFIFTILFFWDNTRKSVLG